MDNAKKKRVAIAIFYQRDVFPLMPEVLGIKFEDRPTGKAVIFDKNKLVALVGNKVNSFYLLPGGGIDKDERVEDGIIRECLEETGCDIKLDKILGVVEDYRNRDKTHCISYCYTANVINESKKLSLTPDEEKNGMHVIWVSIDEAVNILHKQVDDLREGKVKFYNTGFNMLRDKIFLDEAKKISKNEKRSLSRTCET